MMLRFPELSCVALDEKAAIVLVEGKVQVVSADSIAACYIKHVVSDHKGGAHVRSLSFRHTYGTKSLENFLQGKLDVEASPFVRLRKGSLDCKITLDNHIETNMLQRPVIPY